MVEPGRGTGRGTVVEGAGETDARVPGGVGGDDGRRTGGRQGVGAWAVGRGGAGRGWGDGLLRCAQTAPQGGGTATPLPRDAREAAAAVPVGRPLPPPPPGPPTMAGPPWEHRAGHEDGASPVGSLDAAPLARRGVGIRAWTHSEQAPTPLPHPPRGPTPPPPSASPDQMGRVDGADGRERWGGGGRQGGTPPPRHSAWPVTVVVVGAEQRCGQRAVAMAAA